MQYEYHVGRVTYVVTDTETTKTCTASDGSFHYTFDKTTGDFMRWGKTEDDDPLFCPAGPEILDIEVAEGKCRANCIGCYKKNAKHLPAHNMTLDTYKKILDKMPKTLCQVALGICDVDGNPDFLDMLQYTREQGIIPNFTLTGHGLTDEMAVEISKVCGALAVSANPGSKDLCYDTVKKFTDLGMDQINIHIVASKQSEKFLYEVITDRMHDPRLQKMNAIVFLGVKPKGRAAGTLDPMSLPDYARLLFCCLNMGVPFGMDSCSGEAYSKCIDALIKDTEQAQELKEMCEPCCITRFSCYINVDGVYFPCSFMENEENWETGIDVLEAGDFLDDVWFHDRVEALRKEQSEKVMCTGCANCPTFKLIG